MCPICGTALGLSESPQADREREFIRGLIAEGRTKDEIKDALVAEYGDEVLAVPEPKGFDLAAWLVPGIAIVLAAIAIFIGLRRWRRTDRTDGAAEPGRPGATPIGSTRTWRVTTSSFTRDRSLVRNQPLPSQIPVAEAVICSGAALLGPSRRLCMETEWKRQPA